MELKLPSEIEICIDLLRVQRGTSSLRLDDCSPGLPASRNSDDAIGPDGLPVDTEGNLYERLNLSRGCPERLQERPAELRDCRHHGKQRRGSPALLGLDPRGG